MNAARNIFRRKSILALLAGAAAVIFPFILWQLILIGFSVPRFMATAKLAGIFTAVALLFIALPTLFYFYKSEENGAGALLLMVALWTVISGAVIAVGIGFTGATLSGMVSIVPIYFLMFFIPSCVAALIYWHIAVRLKDQPHAYYRLVSFYLVYNFLAFVHAGLVMAD